MKRKALLLLCCAGSISAHAQFVYKLKADSVKITNDACNAELILENSTKNINGFLFNKGNGRTEFRRTFFQVNDSTFVFGNDTLKLKTAIKNYAWLQGGNTFGTTGKFGLRDNNPIEFYTNDSLRGRLTGIGNWQLGSFFIDNGHKLQVNGSSYFNGWVGIGTNNPQRTFHIKGEARVEGGTLEVDNTTGGAGISVFDMNVGGSVRILAPVNRGWTSSITLDQPNMQLRFNHNNGDPGRGIKVWDEGLTIFNNHIVHPTYRYIAFEIDSINIANWTNDGNLLINKALNSNSGEKLQVNGQARIDTINFATSNYSYVVWDSTNHKLKRVNNGLNQYNVATAGDASFTVYSSQQVVTLPVISAARTVTLTGTEGQTLKVYVKNNGVYNWNVSPAIQLKNGTTTTTLTNGYMYDMIYVDGGWKVLNW